MNEKFWILIPISLKFVPKGPIDNKSALIQVMACHLFGIKPLPEPMLNWLPTNICGTTGRWFKEFWGDDLKNFPTFWLSLGSKGHQGNFPLRQGNMNWSSCPLDKNFKEVLSLAQKVLTKSLTEYFF